MKAIVANGFSFEDSNVVNIEDYIPKGEYNPHNIRPWLFYGHGDLALAVVFANCLQDALDLAADEGKLRRFEIDDKELKEYPYTKAGGRKGISHLGNFGVPHDIKSLGVHELDNPPISFGALYNAAKVRKA